MRKIENELIKKAYEGSYYTIIGAGGDLQEWKDGYNELFEKEGIGYVDNDDFITFSGKDYDDEFNLTGDNRYPEDLTFLLFPLDNLNVSKLAIFKIKMGDRWFDDVVENDLYREEH